jgi:hypothetical protein
MLHTAALQLVPSLLVVGLLVGVWKCTAWALDFVRQLLR